MSLPAAGDHLARTTNNAESPPASGSAPGWHRWTAAHARAMQSSRRRCSRCSAAAPTPTRPRRQPTTIRGARNGRPLGHRSSLAGRECRWPATTSRSLIALRIEDVDLEAGTVSVRRQVVETDAGPQEGAPKAGSQRTVHLPEQGVEALDEHLRVRGSALPTARLFARHDGSDLRAHNVHAAWITARKRASLPGAHLHDLRHAGLPLAAQSGATLAEVMRRAGHSSSRAAMIYQHAAERRDAEVAARLGRLAAGTNVNRTGTQRARRGR
jgi:integrase-like protein